MMITHLVPEANIGEEYAGWASIMLAIYLLYLTFFKTKCDSCGERHRD